MGEGLEGGEVVDDLGTEEGGAIRKGGFVDDDLGTLGLDAFHDALDTALAEVVGVGLHGEAIDADDAFFLGGGVEVATVVVVVVAGFLQDLIGDEVLAGAVGLDDGGHHVLGNLGVVGQKLLGILGEAVAAIAEGGVVIMGADAGVEADAIDDGLGVEALHLGIGVEFIEVGDAEGEVGVSKELDGLGFGGAHEEARDAFVK